MCQLLHLFRSNLLKCAQVFTCLPATSLTAVCNGPFLNEAQYVLLRIAVSATVILLFGAGARKTDRLILQKEDGPTARLQLTSSSPMA